MSNKRIYIFIISLLVIFGSAYLIGRLNTQASVVPEVSAQEGALPNSCGIGYPALKTLSSRQFTCLDNSYYGWADDWVWKYTCKNIRVCEENSRGGFECNFTEECSTKLVNERKQKFVADYKCSPRQVTRTYQCTPFQGSCQAWGQAGQEQGCVELSTGCNIYNIGDIFEVCSQKSRPSSPLPPSQPVCGDGNLDAGEQCDLGSGNGPLPSTCSSSCTLNNDSNPDENTLQLQSDPNFISEISIETSEGTFDTDETITTETDYDNQSFFVTSPEQVTSAGGTLFNFKEWIIDGVITSASSTINFTLNDGNSDRIAVVFYESDVPPPPITECNDGDDNDGDTLIDTDDPDCHTDGNAGNASSYNPGDNNEAPPNEPSPVVWIDATPKVVASGGTSLLDWGVNNLGNITSITCTSDSNPDQPDWIDNATTTTEGPRTISPTGIGATTYKITCINSESESGSASVEVIILFGSIKEVNPF